MAKKIAIFLLIILLTVSSTAGAFYVNKNYLPKLTDAITALVEQKMLPNSVITDTTSTKDVVEIASPSDEVKQQVVTEPPTQRATPVQTKTTEHVDGSKTVAVAEGAVAQSELNRVASLPVNTSGTPYGIRYSDETGQHADLEKVLKDYLNNTLKWGNEISYLKEITVRDAGDTGWSGQYGGSYTVSSSGDITSAFGSIILNTHYYNSQTLFNDYMKLVLSHEYGHHYTQYHKWVDGDLPDGTRLPDSYYAVRPLSKNDTTTNCSASWESCESEIVAEDYSYLFSGYGYHAMKSSVGLPSDPGTRDWLNNITANVTSKAVSNSPLPTSSAPAPVNQPPRISITSPLKSSDISDTFAFSADATDDKGVAKVIFSQDGETLAEQTASPYRTIVNAASLAAGAHTFSAKAYDAEGLADQESFTLNITASQDTSSSATNNGTSPSDTPAVSANDQVQSLDTTAPTVTFAKPEDGAVWTGGNLLIKVKGNDDVAVVKTELYVNDQKVVEENGALLQCFWSYSKADNGIYVMKAKAYDAAGNIGEATITITKQ